MKLSVSALNKAVVAIAVMVIMSAGLTETDATAQNQQQGQEKPKDAATMAAEVADYLQGMLSLDDRQVFLVDSTLQFNYAHMMEELEAVRRKGASGTELYELVSDKWSEANDTTFVKFFSDEQWKKYMRTPYGKQKKARDKRQAKKAVRK